MKEYTKIISENIFDEYYDYDEDEDLDKIYNFLKNEENFRPFNEGLIELIIKSNDNFKNQENYDLKVYFDYLKEKLDCINVKIYTQVINDWLTGKHRPKVEENYREKMYQICFALNLELKQVYDFFNEVYFSRAFNCHSIKEAVYYYCFSNKFSYKEAQEMIYLIENSKENTEKNIEIIYTSAIKNKIDTFAKKEHFIEYMKENKHNFNIWNITSYSKIKELFDEINTSKEISKDIRYKINKNISLTDEDKNSCGLFLRYQLLEIEKSDDIKKSFKDMFGKKDITSVKCILDNLLYSYKISSNKNIPYIVKNNFPSEKSFSNILSASNEDFTKFKAYTSKSYDTIRKLLIFLKFFNFWYKYKLGFMNENDMDILFEAYIQETNILLNECGYEDFYVGNPYDWIFFKCAKSDEPITAFENIIGYIVDNI